MHIFNLHGWWWLSQMLENCSLILVNDLVKPFKHLPHLYRPFQYAVTVGSNLAELVRALSQVLKDYKFLFI